MIKDEYVEYDGTIKAYSGWYRTDYLPTYKRIDFTIGEDSEYCCLFDKNKTFIQRFKLTQGNSSLDTPANAYWFIISGSETAMKGFKYNNTNNMEYDIGFDYPSDGNVSLKSYKEPTRYQFPCNGLLYMSVGYGSGAYVKGALYNKDGNWVIGVGIESFPNAQSTVHSTVIPVYKGQYFSYSDITNVTNGSEYVAFVKNYTE